MTNEIKGVLMLVKLEPDDIEKHWDMLDPALREAVPEHVRADEIGLTNILYAILDETLMCWLGVDETVMDKGPYGMITTLFVVDPPSKTKNLLIYTLNGYRPFTKELIEDGFSTLKKYAKAHKCYKLIAYTDVPQIEQMVLNLGGKLGHKLIELEIE